MPTPEPQTYRDVADAAVRWVLSQVRRDVDGPWIPTSVDLAAGSGPQGPDEDRDGMYSGIGGLAHLLAEIRTDRPWTTEEQALADAIAARTRSLVSEQTDYTFFDGLAASIGVLIALGAPGVAPVVERLLEFSGPDGWAQTIVGPPRALPETRLHDATLGAAGVLLAALWARRQDAAAAPSAEDLAGRTADLLVDAVEREPTGANWPFVARRFQADPVNDPAPQMPNYSHGTAGVAAALAAAGIELGRPDLLDLARSGAEHLVSLGDTSDNGLLVPRYLPRDLNDEDEYTYSWCHGCAGTSLMFTALDRAGVETVADRSPRAWERRSLHSIRTSGLPERRYPGFWDNDGRCCGTAGVADVVLSAWQRSGEEQDRELALRLADALVDRAVHDGPHAYWRFVEHRADDPLLPPDVGWMKGAAGIAAYLFRVARVVEQGRAAPTVARMDTWWTLPG